MSGTAIHNSRNNMAVYQDAVRAANDETGKFRFTLIDPNRQTVTLSEGYATNGIFRNCGSFCRKSYPTIPVLMTLRLSVI